MAKPSKMATPIETCPVCRDDRGRLSLRYWLPQYYKIGDPEPTELEVVCYHQHKSRNVYCYTGERRPVREGEVIEFFKAWPLTAPPLR